ncbi:MAG: hypothetical protein K2X27_13475 [Candidatus Obscuribacterales bacterium]|nr:hypothetical protein [Candidatus Obscuribacterales bacterium]
MPNLMSEQEFTERFTERIQSFNLAPRCKENLVLELNYGPEEPLLCLSLKEAFLRYQELPAQLEDHFRPYIQDLRWTVASPRYKSKELYEQSLPVLRNFYLEPPTDDELADSEASPKGPIVYEDLLKAPSEYIAMQFNIFKDEIYTALRKGDTLPCIPDKTLLAQLSLHNLALATESAGITATPLQFESLKAQSWLIGLGDEKYKKSISALSCIPPVMASLEETLKARNGLIAIMPASDQLIVSINNDEQSVCELGVLAQQLRDRAPNRLSAFVWTYQEGNLEAVQSLDLQESVKTEEDS